MSIVAQSMLLVAVPLSLIAHGLRERQQLAHACASIADETQAACQAFAQADADVNAQLETWAAQLATQEGGDHRNW